MSVIEQGGAAAGTISGGSQLVNTKNNLFANSPTVVSVGTSSTSVLGTNSSRKGLVLVNLSSNTISLAFGTTAVLGSGITLSPRGAFAMDEYTYTQSTVTAIASAGSSNLSVQEYQ